MALALRGSRSLLLGSLLLSDLLRPSATASTLLATAAEEVLAVRPLVLAVRGFASAAECAKILALIERCHQGDFSWCKEQHSHLHREPTAATGRPKRNSTSFTLGLEGEVHEAVDALVRRSHILARHPVTSGEGVQIASYGPGDFYEFHHDALHRRATLLLYLTDVAQGDGGETIFPLVRAAGAAEDQRPPLPPAVVGEDRGELLGFKAQRFEAMAPYCASDYYLKVRPEAGMALLFYSYGPDQTMDQYAFHGACPLIRGHKAIFQRWMRFDPNSLYNAFDLPAVRSGRALWGADRLLRPGEEQAVSKAPTASPQSPVAALRLRRPKPAATDAAVDGVTPEL